MLSTAARRLRAALLAGTSAGLLTGALALLRPEPLEAAERLLYDLRAARTAPAARTGVALVAVDDETIRLAGGTYPIPRSALAALVTEARRAGAGAVALDFLLVDPLEGALAEENAALEAALRGGRTWLAATATEDPGHPGTFLVQPPLPRFAAAATGLGVVSQRQDADGKVRSLRHVFRDAAGGQARSLPFAVATAMARPGDGQAGGDDASLAQEPDGRTLVRWTRPARPGPTYPEVSGARLLQAALAREGEGTPPSPADLAPLEGAVAIVSPTAAAAKDKRPTPVNPEAVGGEVLATALDDLLHRDFVRRATPGADAAFAFSVALGAALLAALAALAALRPGAGLALSALGVVATLSGAWWIATAAVGQGRWLAAAAPLLGGLLGGLAAQGALFASERRDRRVIHDALGRYTSPALVRTLLDRPELLDRFGGARQELTVYFSDLRGFTSFSEGLSPERLVELLNEYLSAMTEVVERHGGYVDKYVGDAIMAIWGAPVPAADHAARACRSALAMRDRLAELAPGWRARYGADLFARAGLNTAQVVAGNIGSRRKASYTVMGDGVNLASRLEGANKAYGTAILVGEGTRAAAQAGGGGFAFRSIDVVRVKGKHQGVAISELVGPAGGLDEATRAWLAAWETAMADYRGRRFAEARAAFAALAAERPDDEPARLYLARCDEQLATAGAEAWDGVHELHEK